MKILKLGTSLAVALIVTQAAFAGEWRADRLRGVVLTMVDDEWTPMSIGDVVDDSRIIRTGANGHVTFSSGDQILEMRPNSQIQISAVEARDYTWILHAGGEITADVDARDVEHFGVRTFHMVAVVKGTRFTVVADQDGGSVAVERGTVAVHENERGLTVAIGSGQRAISKPGSLQVDGSGDLPTVVDAEGRAAVAPVTIHAGSQAGAPMNTTQGGPRTTEAAPGNSGNAPGRSGDAPGNSGNAPGRSGDAPGNSGNAPGRSGDAPGKSGNAPGRSGDAPGNSGHPQGTGNGRR